MVVKVSDQNEMKAFSNISAYYKKITSGIAFLPSLISVGIALLAVGFVSLQQVSAAQGVLSSINFIQVNDSSTARAILAALLTGTISLTVFSFSMVMVVVNQSASNYSPKVIEGFISETANQIILGVYIGTILFVTVSLTQVSDMDNYAEVPHFNVFASILLMTACVALFILFIKNISNSVRINNVAERIFVKTRIALQQDSHEHSEYPEGKEWVAYEAVSSGYFQSISTAGLMKILRREKIMLKVVPYYGSYLHSQHKLFCLSKEITDEKVLKDIRGTFNIYSGENVQENYFYGFRQLREVAVKALSPGINDPGIAIICLDYLSELLIIYLDHEKKISLKEDKGVGIFFMRHTFADMLDLIITPIHAYAKQDFLVLAQILRLLYNVALHDTSNEVKQLLTSHGNSVLDTAKDHLYSTQEIQYIDQLVADLNEKSKLNICSTN